MIAGISIYEIFTLTSILFFIGIYGFITRKNLISILISLELILNASAINFVVINKYLYPDVLQGVFFSIFIIAVAAAETALAVAIIINLYRQISSVEVKDTTRTAIPTSDGRRFVAYKPVRNYDRRLSQKLWSLLAQDGIKEKNSCQRASLSQESADRLMNLSRKNRRG